MSPVEQRRVYLPLTADQLRTLAETRVLPAPLEGLAAGAQGRVDSRVATSAAIEEAEYVAFRAAAGEPVEGARRIVASADLPAHTLNEGTAPGDDLVPVTTTEELPLRLVVSIHIDEQPASGDDEPDLLWYDVTEIDTVVAELDA